MLIHEVQTCKTKLLKKVNLIELLFFIFLSGALNFTIGQDVIDGFGENEFARIREEAEFSAVYLVPNPPNNTEESTDNQGN